MPRRQPLRPPADRVNHEYKKKGVIFLAINSNAHETQEQVAKFVKETGIDFPVLKDVQNKVSDTVLAERTCETLVLDGFGRIRYRGAIDDQYAQGKAKDKPAHTYVKDALDAIVANRPIKVTATRVAGCLLDRVDPKLVEPGRAPRGSGRPRPRSRRSLRPASGDRRSRSAP